MKQSSDSKNVPMTSFSSGHGKEVLPDLYYYTNQIVNVVMIGRPDGEWVLVDCGLPGSGDELIEVAEQRFGKNRPPAAILLTHGHFDHVGSIVALLKKWDVPVYAHELEFPYLTNKQAYPEPDSTVEGGLLAKMAGIYPHEPIDITASLKPLPADGTVPELPAWRWIHAPGHSPGQVVFFRADDKTLLSADAFITVRQDSFYKVLIQKKDVNGPPRYFTTDWKAAKETVQKLRDLQPALVVSGHGQAMKGGPLRLGLKNLADNFDELAVPDHGKFV